MRQDASTMQTAIKALIVFGLLLGATSAAKAQSPTLPPNTVLGRTGITPGPAQAIPFSVIGNLVAAASLPAALDTQFCTTVGAALIRQTAGWMCSTAGGTDGVVFGAAALNTPQINVFLNSAIATPPFEFSTTAAVSSPFDWRWVFTQPALSPGVTAGPNFYVTVSPSTSADVHDATYAGMNATVYSDNSGVLANMIGGNFNAIRRNTGGGGSTNPVIGVTGTAVMGIAGDPGGATGDGTVGGIFSSYPQRSAGGGVFDPLSVGGFTGLIGRVISFGTGSTIAMGDVVGTDGYAGIEGTTTAAYGLYSSVDSRSHTMALAGSAYGLYIKSITGTQNIAAAIRTNAGSVIFGGNEALVGNLIGGTTVTALSKPTINKVWGGATGQFSEAAGYGPSGTKTYTYQVVAKFKAGINSAPATAVNNNASHLGYDDLSVAGQNNYIQWTPVEGATSYDIYRTAAPGAVTNTTGKIANVLFDAFPSISNNPLTPTPPSYADAGAVGDATSPPAGTPASFQVDGGPLADAGTGAGTGPIIAGSLISLGAPLKFGVNGGSQWQIDSGGHFSGTHGLGVGSQSLTMVDGGIALTKRTASGSAPGAAGARIELVCGTGAGTAKLIIYAGTSTTPVTITDNIGAGVTGC